MRLVPSCAALCAALVLSACNGTFGTSYDAPVPAEVSRDWRVTDVRTVVPDSLTVSDDNVLVPIADIVWHGDPPGDRRAQVAAIVTEGLTRGSAPLDGDRAVGLVVELQRFHGITPVAVNRSPSGVHNIAYRVWVRDAVTGEPILGPVRIEADLVANTQSNAVMAEMAGVTERERIVDHLSAVTAGWLGVGPDPRETFVSIGH